MNSKTILTLLVVASVVAMVPFSSGQGGEKVASYVGTQTLIDHDLNEQCADALGEEECPVRIIRGIIFVSCDGVSIVADVVNDAAGDDVLEPTGPDGAGGVRFCFVDAWHGGWVRVDIADDLEIQGPVAAKVTCRMADPGSGLNWVEEIEEGAGTITFFYHPDCIPVESSNYPEPSCSPTGVEEVDEVLHDLLGDDACEDPWTTGHNFSMFFHFGYATQGQVEARQTTAP